MAANAAWSVRDLKDCATWYSGGTPSRAVSSYWNGDIPWISAKSLVDFYVKDSEEYVTEEGAQNGTRLVPKDTILFVVRGMSLKSEFRVGLTTREVTFNQDLKALVAKEGVHAPFLAYAIRARTEEILQLVGEAGHGTGVLPTDRIQSLAIAMPSLPEQRRIAGVAQALDFKIDLNRRINQTLEAMAQAIFKSWFVDFDPVKAKIAAIQQGRDPLRAAMSAISGKSDAELDALPPEQYDPLAATAALFPDGMEESELGEIPRGWEAKPLDSVADYLNGLALQKFPPKCASDFLPVIKIAQLRAGHTAGADQAASDLKPEYVVCDGDVLFSWSGSLEVDVWTGGRGALNQHLFKVTSSVAPKWFYLLATKYHLPQFREIAANKATTMGHIQRKHLSDARIATPSSEFLDQATKVVSPLVDEIISVRLQSRELAKARDTLLPKLLSGELSAEALAEPAGVA